MPRVNQKHNGRHRVMAAPVKVTNKFGAWIGSYWPCSCDRWVWVTVHLKGESFVAGDVHTAARMVRDADELYGGPYPRGTR